MIGGLDYMEQLEIWTDPTNSFTGLYTVAPIEKGRMKWRITEVTYKPETKTLVRNRMPLTHSLPDYVFNRFVKSVIEVAFREYP